MQASVTHISPLTFVRRARLLPGNGRVLAHEDQKVAAADVVAEGWSFGQHVLIDLRRALGVARVDQAEKMVTLNEGDHLAVGDVIAQTGGLMARTLRSPVEGQLSAIQGGRILIESPGQVIRLAAGFAGTVSQIIPNRGVVVETHAALVQGVWGNERFDQGMLLSVIHEPDQELTDKILDVSMRGAVIVGGHCGSAAVLRMAEELPLRGLVLSSLDPELIDQASLLAVPVIVVEGFGRLPYDSVAFRILSTSEKRDACMKASKPDPARGERPELILPLPAIGEESPDQAELQAGQTVRILDAIAPSRVGVINAIRPGLTRLPAGLTVAAVDVKLEPSNDIVTVPAANLEILA